MERKTVEKIIEKLAELEHQQWSHWETYRETKKDIESQMRWVRKSHTPYSELSEKDKESDRKWAKKVLALLRRMKVIE